MKKKKETDVWKEPLMKDALKGINEASKHGIVWDGQGNPHSLDKNKNKEK